MRISLGGILARSSFGALMSADALAIATAHALALLALFGVAVPGASLRAFAIWIAPIILVYGGVNLGFGVYRLKRDKMGLSDLSRVLLSGTLGLALVGVGMVTLQDPTRPISLKAVCLGGVLTIVSFAFVRFRTLRPALILVSVSTLVALFIAEMFLRYLYDPLDVNRFVRETPYGKYREMLIKDPILGFRLKPNSHVVFERADVDHYKMEVRINSIGIRDVEYSVARPEGVVRILFVGDSIVFGAGIEADQTMAKLLEKLLNEHAQEGVKYEVMNWGVGSYGLRQELGLLMKDGAARYQPDLLLVGTGPNDFGASLNPNTYEEQTGLLATADVQANLLTQPAHGARSLKLYRLSGYAVRRLLSHYATWFVPHDVSSSESALSTRKDLHDFKEYADSLGIPIGFVLFPGGELLDPASPGNTYQRAQYDFFREQFTQMRVPWLDSLPAIREATQRTGRGMYVQWDNLHFNAEGNQVIARELLGFVRSIGHRSAKSG